jgi:hypothetical protein
MITSTSNNNNNNNSASASNNNSNYNNNNNANVNEVEQVANGVGRFLWTCDNRYHPLPEDFEFPRAQVSIGWRNWWFGSTLKYNDQFVRTIPYRNIIGSDLQNVKLKKHYEQWEKLFKSMEYYLKLKNDFIGNPNENQIVSMFLASKGFLSKIAGRNNWDTMHVCTPTERLRKLRLMDANDYRNMFPELIVGYELLDTNLNQ